MRIYIVVINVLGVVGKQLAADLIRRAAKDHNIDRHVVVQQELANSVHRHAQRLILGVAEDAGGDQRKCHRLTAVLLRQRKARPVAGGELFPLAVLTAVPHRAHGVDHIFARQAVRARDLGLAGPAAAERPALLEQLRPCRTVDAAVHAASAQQGFLRRIDDGIHAHFRDVIANNFKRHGSIPQFLSFKIRSTRRCPLLFPLRTVLPNPHDFRICEGSRGHHPRRMNRSCKT